MFRIKYLVQIYKKLFFLATFVHYYLLTKHLFYEEILLILSFGSCFFDPSGCSVHLTRQWNNMDNDFNRSTGRITCHS